MSERPFEGTIPEGSLSKYVVYGTGIEVHVRLSDSTRWATDGFLIASDAWLKEDRQRLKYPGAYDHRDLRSINPILGNTALAYAGGATGAIDFSGLYHSPAAHLGRGHLGGVFEQDSTSHEIEVAR